MVFVVFSRFKIICLVFKEYEWTSQFLDSFTNDFSTNMPKTNNIFSSPVIHPPSHQQIQTPPHVINDYNIPQHSQWMPWNEQSYM